MATAEGAVDGAPDGCCHLPQACRHLLQLDTRFAFFNCKTHLREQHSRLICCKCDVLFVGGVGRRRAVLAGECHSTSGPGVHSAAELPCGQSGLQSRLSLIPGTGVGGLLHLTKHWFELVLISQCVSNQPKAKYLRVLSVLCARAVRVPPPPAQQQTAPAAGLHQWVVHSSAHVFEAARPWQTAFCAPLGFLRPISTLRIQLQAASSLE